MADLADPSVAVHYLATARAVGAALSAAEPVAVDDPWSPGGVPDEAVAALAEHVGPGVAAVVPAARELPWSVCHGDLGASNVVTDGRTMWVVDFEHLAPSPGPTSVAAEQAFVGCFSVRYGLGLAVPGTDPAQGPGDPATLAVAAHLVSRTGMNLHAGGDPARCGPALEWLRSFVAATA